MGNYIDIIKSYTYDDFTSTIPYEYLYQFNGSPFDRNQLLSALKKRAMDVGYKDFVKTNKGYIETRKLDRDRKSQVNKTSFSNQPLALDCGDWIANDEGVYRINQLNKREYACRHPITLVARLEDHDDKSTQFVVGYRMPGEKEQWKELVFENLDLSTTSGITKLATWGISVTSVSATKLMAYFDDLKALNYDRIPMRLSIKRMGYIDGVGFAPYSEKLVFGATAEYRALYDTICAKGDYQEWLAIAKQCRKESIAAHIILAASFASPLLKVVGCLPFFVHVWCPVSGSGKTVSLMLAASVWGNPGLGQYVQTLNATQVGMEKTAAFLGQLPYCMDELQLAKDQNGNSRIDVYQLAEGIGRTRGNKGGGVDATSRWQCCFLTTGETPITDVKRGSGAVNRVVDIGCTTDKPAVSNGPAVVPIITANYGHAGRVWVSKIYEYPVMLESIRITYGDYRRKLEQSGVTSKQAMAAAVILTASNLAAQWIFKDDNMLTVEDIVPYLATNETASLGVAAYEYLQGWVAQNTNHFVHDGCIPNGDVYGSLEDGVAWIIRSAFNEALAKAKLDPMAVLRFFKDENIIIHRGNKGYTQTKRFGNNPVQCVVLKLVHFGQLSVPQDPTLPF